MADVNQKSNHNEVWRESLQIIKNIVPDAVYTTWFKPIKPLSLVDTTLTIEVPSDTYMRQIEDCYIDILAKTLRRVVGEGVKLKYNIRVTEDSTVTLYHQNDVPPKNRDIPFPRPAREYLNPFIIPGLRKLTIDPQLNPRYSFENFIEGSCNRLARSAGEKVAEEPGTGPFNPLFIYGGAGLGKTHLAQAIGLKIKESLPDKIVLYVNANRFMTQYVDAVNVKNKFTDFINFYQMMDVLILDDAQEFATKPGTQNAFFHIFNHLHQLGKQLILTSDCSPKEMGGLDNRLLSRFKWGLSAELLPPDFKTRVKILRAKSALDGIELSDEVINFVAEKVTGSIRELEGTLISLVAHSTLNREDITIDLARRVIRQLVNEESKELSTERIRNEVCEYFKISPEMLLSKVRKREVVQARQIAMYLARNLAKASFAEIGKKMGGKDHTTVLYACNAVQDLMETDLNIRRSVLELTERLQPVVTVTA